MSKYWLKLIGTSERHCPDIYDDLYVESRGRMRMHQIRPGDRMILYAVGRDKRVFALAEVTSKVYDSGNPEWPYKVNIKYEVNLPVDEGVHIDEISTPIRDLRRSLRQRAYIKLLPEEYKQAEIKLREATKSRGFPEPAATRPSGGADAAE